MKGAKEMFNEHIKPFKILNFGKLKRKGWKKEKKFIYGKYNDYDFTVFQGDNYKGILMPLKGISKPQIEIIQSFFTNNAKKYNLKNYFFEGEFLRINISEKFFSLSSGKLENMLEEFTMFLNLSDINLKNRCIFCGEDNAYETILKEKVLCPSHQECYAQEDTKLKVEKNNLELENKNYFRGTIGALLGGIIVVILNLLFSAFTNRTLVIIGIFIVLGAFKGYKFLGGKIGRGTKSIIVFSTIFSVILIPIADIIYSIIFNKASLTIENFIYIAALKENLLLIIKELVVNSIAAIVGIGDVIRRINIEIKGGSPKLKKVSL